MASEKTLLTAVNLFKDPDFRHQRLQESPHTCPEYDARAAAFAAMDVEGKFDATVGEPMSPKQEAEFELISGAVLKMSK